MRGYQRRASIERKILTPILWVGLIPITVALIVGYAVTYQGQKVAVLRNLSTAAQTTASGLQLALSSRLRTVQTLSHDPEIAAALIAGPKQSAEARASLASRLDVEGDAAPDGPSEYTLYDAEGSLVLSTGKVSESDQVRETWPAQVQETKFVDFKYDYETNRYFARSVAPVFAPKTNERIGFLCEDQDARSLLYYGLGREAQGDSDASGADVYQIAYRNPRGGLLMNYLDPGPPAVLRMDNPDLKFQAAVQDPKHAAFGALRIRHYATRGTNVDVMLAYYRFMGQEGGSQIYIVVYRPAAAVFAYINQWALYSVIGSGIVIGLFLIFSYRSVHNNIVLPVSLLNEGAQIIRQGDLDLKLKIFTGDEIEELASSFNKMALHLSQNVRQLEDSEEKYRSLINSMRDGIYQTDSEGIVTFANPAGADILGYSATEEAIGQNLRELFLEEIDYARILNELNKQSFVERTRIWMKRKDGRAICVELSANRVADDEGNVIGAEGIFRDVTAAVRFEQQARERSERISAINQIANVINSSLESGRLHESLIVELKKLVDFDYAAVSLFDEKDEGFEKRQLWPERRLTGQVPAAAAAASATAWVFRNRASLCVGDLRQEPVEHGAEFPIGTLSCLCVPLYATGRGGRISGTLNLGSNRVNAFSKHDVEVLEEMSPHIAVAMHNARLLDNLQQSLEEVTRAREKLHEANEELKTLDEMKTNLLSNVSHELRTPLVSVMGYTDMLFNRKVGAINDVQGEYLGIIMRNVEKLVTLIENLLDFSRLHRGTEKLVFASFDLVDCARTSIQTVQPVADGRIINISLVTSNEKVFIEGDKGKMGQVFNNLLSNAVKFNKNNGSVTVKIQQKEDSVEVTVSDTGIGIPPEALDKVFTRFYQYDSSSTRKYGGTGIGLSIAQDIVRLHGSRITATSEEGKGSVFRFSLPLKPAQEGKTEGTPAEKPEAALPSETHLLVEVVTQDRGLNLQIHDLLIPEGMNVVHASQVESAIDLARRYRPDCILVDADSSRQDGEDGEHPTIERLLDDKDAASVPIVILTNDDDLYLHYRLRVAGRIRHGFRKSSLLGGIHYAINQRGAPTEPLGNKILCVDDDPEILLFISRCLGAEGYTMDTCDSGQEALQRIATREYGLLLLDIAMPGLDGWEVCRTIKSDPSLAGLKVHFVSAKPIGRAASRLQDVGADGYLSKPFKSEDLMELVRGAIPAPAVGEA